MTDVFDEEDAALVLHFYEKFNRFTFGYYTVDLSDKWRVRKLVRMGVVFSMGGGDKYYLKLNQDHPDVKAIIDALDLL